MGNHFNFLIVEFDNALCFSVFNNEHPYCDFCNDFDATAMYVELCDNPLDTYELSKSKDLYLRDPCMKYIHRFLAYSFSGQKDAPNILSKIKLYFMWCMIHKRRVNLSF